MTMLKVSLYFDQPKTKLADYQTYSVAVDVAVTDTGADS